jgi:hypothetical protein
LSLVQFVSDTVVQADEMTTIIMDSVGVSGGRFGAFVDELVRNVLMEREAVVVKGGASGAKQEDLSLSKSARKRLRRKARQGEKGGADSEEDD